MVDAARRDGSARVIAGCGASMVELRFGDRRISAEAGRDASKANENTLTPEDEIVLEILGWQKDALHDTFVREWHPDTTSADIAGDVLRAAVNAYRCDAVELTLNLAPAPRVSAFTQRVS